MSKLTLPHALQATDVQNVMAILHEEGGEARFVGGCVRDMLYPGAQVQDIDVATTHSPENVLRLMEKHQIKAIPTGIEHGTITVVLANKNHIEVTTLRSDVACYGRHAEVVFTTSFEEDAKRRDFTMNAMSCSPDGQLFDYYGGQDDLKQKRIIFVGDPGQRVQEDYLRILRFFRFHAVLQKDSVDEKGLAACIQYKDGLKELSGQRIQNEMKKLLNAPAPYPIVKIMHETGILRTILPLPVNPDILDVPKAIPPIQSFDLQLALLLRSAKADADDITQLSKAWALSNNDKAGLMLLITQAERVRFPMDEQEQKKAIRALGKQGYNKLLLCDWAENGSDVLNHSEYTKALELSYVWDIPEFPLAGKDILAIGVPAGQRIGALLKEAENWWEAEAYKPTKDALLEYIKGKA